MSENQKNLLIKQEIPSINENPANQSFASAENVKGPETFAFDSDQPLKKIKLEKVEDQSEEIQKLKEIIKKLKEDNLKLSQENCELKYGSN